MAKVLDDGSFQLVGTRLNLLCGKKLFAVRVSKIHPAAEIFGRTLI
jgi:hypothetical protein